MPHEDFANPIMSNRTKFRSNTPVSELIKRVTQAIEASDAASTPPVARTTNGATVTKASRPLTKSLPRAVTRGRLDLQERPNAWSQNDS